MAVVGEALRKVTDLCGIPFRLPAFWGYACYALYTRALEKFDETEFANDSVYCIGSGPSLDEFDLGAVRGSTILFLNSAIDAHHSIHASNRILWLCADVNAFLTTADRVPKDVRRVVTVHRYEKALRVIAKLDRSRDHFLLPRPTIRRKYPHRDGPDAGRLYFRPSYALRDGTPFALNSVYDGYVYPATVMLLAIAVGLLLARRGIHVVGFDMGHGPEGSTTNYSAKILSANATGPNSFPVETIEAYLSMFSREAERKGIDIYNHSPYAPERILKRTQNGHGFLPRHD